MPSIVQVLGPLCIIIIIASDQRWSMQVQAQSKRKLCVSVARLFAVQTILLLLSGCTAHQLPRPLTFEERQLIDARPFKDIVLGVEWSAQEVYLADLYKLDRLIE